MSQGPLLWYRRLDATRNPVTIRNRNRCRWHLPRPSITYGSATRSPIHTRSRSSAWLRSTLATKHLRKTSRLVSLHSRRPRPAPLTGTSKPNRAPHSTDGDPLVASRPPRLWSNSSIVLTLSRISPDAD